MLADGLYAKALEMDQTDPLRDFRERFVLPPDIIYLDGNSLGPAPWGVRGRITRLLDYEWGQRLVRGWNENWLELPERLAGKIASLIGAHPDEVLIADSVSVNFFKLAQAAAEFQSQNGRGGDGAREGVIAEKMGFPTNKYILERVFPKSGFRWVDSPDGIVMPPEEVESRMDDSVALLSLNHVNFRSGWMHDMERLNGAARERGILNLWDLSHSVGAVPLDLHKADCDLAVGCTYKYLNGGPGAPAFMFVRRSLQKRLLNPIQGWFGHAEFFQFSDEYAPASGVRRFMTGTPAILSMAAVEAGVDITVSAGMGRIRRKSVAMSDYFLEVWQEKLAPLGVRLNSPSDSAVRGSHVSLGHDQAFAIDTALIKRMGVIPDFRKPDNIRFGLAPLYNRFSEIYEALERIRLMLTDESYQKVDASSGEVT